MFGKHKSDVLVVGAGPVGLFAAAEMVRRGIDVEIVEAEWQGASLSYALAVHPGSVELLEPFGLAEAVTGHGYHVEKIGFYEGTERRAEVNLSALDAKYPFLTILPQAVMEQALADWLAHRKVKVRWQHRVTDIGTDLSPTRVILERWGEDMVGYAVARRTRVIEKTLPHDAAFVIGADGHSSVVRRRLDAAYQEIAPRALFAVFEFQTDADLQHEARVILNDDTTNILWPLPGGRCRWSFQLTNPEEFEGERVKNRLSEIGHWIFPTLDEDRLHALIADRAPWFDARITEVIWSVAIKFERRLTGSFGHGALWLAGDSAHLASPVGVHSMNVGFREVHDLADRMETSLRGGNGAPALDGYDLRWRLAWRRLMNLDDTLKVRDSAPSFVKKNATRILSCLTASGRHLDTLLGQLGMELPGND